MGGFGDCKARKGTAPSEGEAGEAAGGEESVESDAGRPGAVGLETTGAGQETEKSEPCEAEGVGWSPGAGNPSWGAEL